MVTTDVYVNNLVRTIAAQDQRISVLSGENAELLAYKARPDGGEAKLLDRIKELENQLRNYPGDIEDLDTRLGIRTTERDDARDERDKALGRETVLRRDVETLEGDLRKLGGLKEAADREIDRLKSVVIKGKDAEIAAWKKAKAEADNKVWWCEQRLREVKALYRVLRNEHDHCLPTLKMTCIIAGRGVVAGAQSYPAGMNVEIAAVPWPGWALAYAGFTLDGVAVESPYRFVMPNHNVIVTALFVYMGNGERLDELVGGDYLSSEVYEEVLLTERGWALGREEYIAPEPEPEPEPEPDYAEPVLLTEGGYVLIAEEPSSVVATEGGEQIITETELLLSL